MMHFVFLGGRGKQTDEEGKCRINSSKRMGVVDFFLWISFFGFLAGRGVAGGVVRFWLFLSFLGFASACVLRVVVVVMKIL